MSVTATTKRRRKTAPPPPASPPQDGRLALRALHEFILTQDPVALAAQVTDIDRTLTCAVRLTNWLHHYTQALCRRRPQ